MIENEMRPAVTQWLNRNDYDDAHECLLGGYCDVIGCKWDERVGRKPPDLLETIAIELKMRDIQGVIMQAKGNHYHANLSYCVMPQDFILKMRPQSLQNFKDAGVGLLTWLNGCIGIIIYSTYNNVVPHEVLRRRLWAFKLRHSRTGAKP